MCELAGRVAANAGDRRAIATQVFAWGGAGDAGNWASFARAKVAGC